MKFIYRPIIEVELEFAGDDHIAKSIQNAGKFYESALLRYIEDIRLPRGLAIDVGANIGNHTVHFGLCVASKVVALEPSPRLFDILLRNCANNRINSECFPYAAGASMKKAAFIPGPAHNLGMGRVVLDDDGPIQVIPIDGLQLEPTFIKVDVEGMELDVLYGAQRTIRQHKPHLFLEAKDLDALEVLEEVLRPMGYEAIISFGATPVWHFAPEGWVRP